MGLKKHIQKSFSPRSRNENELTNRSISGSDVTEESLQAWLTLPPKIRHDPSLASFKIEHERLHGHDFDEDSLGTNADENENKSDQSEFISMNILRKEVRKEPEATANANCPSASSEYHSNTHESKSDKPELCFHSNTWQNNFKITGLLIVWTVFTLILAQKDEKEILYRQIVIPKLDKKYFSINGAPTSSQLLLIVEGGFYANGWINGSTQFLSVGLESFNRNTLKTVPVPNVWKLPLLPPRDLDSAVPITRKLSFDMANLREMWNDTDSELRLKFESNSNMEFGIRVGYDIAPVNINYGVIYGIAVLVSLYVLIISEIVHRTFAAMILSVCSIGILAILNDRPTMVDIVIWMDIETLMLLFSMMILVAILTETGAFDHIAVYSFRITGGKIWPLIHCLCIVTVLVSSCLDNVTTILLLTPVSIRLCEVMHLNPVPVLMAMVIHANIGGTITPIGDPPNIMISLNPYIARHGVSFLSFSLHMIVGVILVMIQTAVQLRIQYRDIHSLRMTESKEIKDMRREIGVWKRAAGSLPSLAKKGDIVRDTLIAKVKFMQHKLKKMELSGTDSKETYKLTLDELKHQYPIKNKILLIKSGFVLIFVLALFFVQSIPNWQKLSLGWCALLGVILLIIITEKDDMDVIMHRIEWTTLIFFAALFVTMECLERLGLTVWIGKQSENIILSVGENARLAVAILIILWVSAITSAFVESIPVTAMMIKVVVSLAGNPALGLPLQPLVWALAYGPALGGNGTLYGASANVVCAGIAEQHGYKISFMEYMKVCFPIMIGSIVVITGYLMAAHIVFTWH